MCSWLGWDDSLDPDSGYRKGRVSGRADGWVDPSGDGEFLPSPAVAEEDARLRPDEEAIARHLRRVKDRVEYLLTHYPSTRNSDTYLMWLYLRKFCGVQVPFLTWKQLSEINLESVRRVRQKLQEEGRYLPTNPEVARKRRRLSQAYRKAILNI